MNGQTSYLLSFDEKSYMERWVRELDDEMRTGWTSKRTWTKLSFENEAHKEKIIRGKSSTSPKQVLIFITTYFHRKL